MTKIEWTEDTWNPLAGCSIVSPGCTNCYAMRMAARMEAMGDAAVKAGRAVPAPHYTGTTKWVNGNPVWTGKVALAGERTLLEPLRRKKPTMYFVNSMSDLFHEDVPDAWIDRVFAVMALSPQHTFQVLSKRSKRMRDYFGDVRADGDRRREIAIDAAMKAILAAALPNPEDDLKREWRRQDAAFCGCRPALPLPNVWLGVSAERQQESDKRIPDLLATPATVRFVSAEPLLGPIDFDAVRYTHAPGFFGSALRWHHRGACHVDEGLVYPSLDWIIVGGESGPGARPMHPDWARSIRDQCAAAGTAFFFKQWGRWALFADGDGEPDLSLAHRNDWMLVYRDGGIDAPDGRWPSKGDGECAMLPVGKGSAGRLLDGVTHDAMPTPAQREVAA